MGKTGDLTGYGYDVLDGRFDGPLPRLRRYRVPGTDRTYNLRDGSVGFLLIHFVLWWHEKIFRIDKGIWDEWGWAVRPTRGKTTGFSEHAGGSAADINATLHPRGVPLLRNLKPLQIIRIRRRVKFYRGCLSWGGNYQKTVDGMHIERANGVSIQKMEAEAKRLMDTPRGRRILAANPGLKEVILS